MGRKGFVGKVFSDLACKKKRINIQVTYLRKNLARSSIVKVGKRRYRKQEEGS